MHAWLHFCVIDCDFLPFGDCYGGTEVMHWEICFLKGIWYSIRLFQIEILFLIRSGFQFGTALLGNTQLLCNIFSKRHFGTTVLRKDLWCLTIVQYILKASLRYHCIEKRSIMLNYCAIYSQSVTSIPPRIAVMQMIKCLYYEEKLNQPCANGVTFTHVTFLRYLIR